MYGSLGKEVHRINEELQATSEGLHTVKQELNTTKQEISTTRQELNTTRQELNATKQELDTSQRIVARTAHLFAEQNSNRVEAIQQRQDGIVETLRELANTLENMAKEGGKLLDRVKTDVTRDLKRYIEEDLSVFGLPEDEAECLIHQTLSDVYTKDEVDERLDEVQKQCCLVQQTLADVYTKDEVGERLDEVQKQCEGLNNLETEEMVLGARDELECDIRKEYYDATQDLQERVHSKMRMVYRMVRDKLQIAEERMVKAMWMQMKRMMRRRKGVKKLYGAAFGRNFERQLRAGLVTVQALQSPPSHDGEDTSSTASTASQ